MPAPYPFSPTASPELPALILALGVGLVGRVWTWGTAFVADHTPDQSSFR